MFCIGCQLPPPVRWGVPSVDPSRRDPAAVALGARVRALRQTRGWSRDQLAERTNLSHRTLVYLESGGVSPTLRTLLLVAEALEVRPGTLVDDLA